MREVADYDSSELSASFTTGKAALRQRKLSLGPGLDRIPVAGIVSREVAVLHRGNCCQEDTSYWLRAVIIVNSTPLTNGGTDSWATSKPYRPLIIMRVPKCTHNEIVSDVM